MPIGWKELDAPVLFQSSLSSRSQTKIYIEGFPELLSGFILIGSRQRSDKFVSLKKSEDFQFGGVNAVTLSVQFQQIMGLMNYSSMAVRSVLPLIWVATVAGPQNYLFLDSFIHSFILTIGNSDVLAVNNFPAVYFFNFFFRTRARRSLKREKKVIDLRFILLSVSPH